MLGTALRRFERALERLTEPHHLVGRPDGVGVLREARDLFRPHGRARGDDEIVVVDRARRGRHPLRRRVDPLRAPVHEADVPAIQRRRQLEDEALGLLAERDVDRVGLEEELVAIGNERQVGTPTEALTQIEDGLEPAESAAEDGDAGIGTIVRRHRDLLWVALALACCNTRSAALGGQSRKFCVRHSAAANLAAKLARHAPGGRVSKHRSSRGTEELR